MTDALQDKLATELGAFDRFHATTPFQSINEQYHRVVAVVQRLMLETDNPDGHDRAWSLLKDGAFKDLEAFQAGHHNALEELKIKMKQIGHFLLNAD